MRHERNGSTLKPIALACVVALSACVQASSVDEEASPLADWDWREYLGDAGRTPVSYTHLTLPTIYSV